MKKFLVALLLIPSLALGASTWTNDVTTPYRVSKLVATTGTEAAPATAGSTGISLVGIRGFTVHIEASGAMTAGGKLLAYMWNPASARWNPVPDLDLTVAAIQYQSFAGFASVANSGRIAYVPSGVGVGSTIYIVGNQ